MLSAEPPLGSSAAALEVLAAVASLVLLTIPLRPFKSVFVRVRRLSPLSLPLAERGAERTW